MAMHFSADQHEEYLNRYLGELWAAASPLLMDQTVHKIGEKLPDIARPVHDADFQFTMPPGLTLSADGTSAELRLPRSGDLSVSLALANDFSAGATFHIRGRLSAGAPPEWTPSVAVGIGYPWYVVLGTLAAGVITAGQAPLIGGAVAVFAAHILKEIIEDVLGGALSGTSLGSLGSLSTMRFDRAAPYEPDTVALELLNPADLGTETGVTDWIDIVLIGDNYDAADAAEFTLQTDVIAAALLDGARIDNIRLREMASAIRVWRFALQGTADNEKIARSGTSNGKSVATLSNLARLAETGLRIEEELRQTHHSGQPLVTKPILVVLKRPSSAPRAISMANLILLPIAKDEAGAKAAASVLIHELGHTVGTLADEYSDPADPYYQGLEPLAVNVSKTQSSPKWARWNGTLPKAADAKSENYRVTSPMGGYEFANVFRPALFCKMNQSAMDVAFCPVCEETLAVGLLERVGWNGVGVQAPLTIEVEYLAPWWGPPRRLTLPVAVSGGGAPATVPLEVGRTSRPGEDTYTMVRVSVVGAAVPDRRQTLQQPGEEPRQTQMLLVTPDSTVRLRVAPGPDAPLPPEVRQGVHQSVSLVFEREPSVVLEPPSALRQRPPVGQSVKRVLDPANGDLSTNVQLSATSAVNTRQRTETVFAWSSGGTEWTESFEDPAGDRQKHMLDLKELVPGSYKWAAFARIRHTEMRELESARVSPGLGSHAAHFVVLPHDVPVYTQLPAPFDLYILSVVKITSGGQGFAVAQPAQPFRMRARAAGRSIPGGIPLPHLPQHWPPRPPKLPVPWLPGLEGIELVGGIVPGSIVPVDLPQPDLVSLALVASAYDPRGGPITFEFDMPELGSFTTDPVPVASQTTLRVSAVRALDPKTDTDTLFKKTEWRVRTRDAQGVRSPWVVSAPPHRCDFMLAGGTRLPVPRRFVAGS